MYIYAAIDDYSRYCVGIEAVSSKDAKTISNCSKKFIELNGRPTIVWCDNGGENVGDKAVELLREKEIGLIKIFPLNTQQNGKIERFWPSLEKMTTSDSSSLETFRNNYNNIIPHSSLSMDVPAKLYLGNQKWKVGDEVFMKVEENGKTTIHKMEIKISQIIFD